MHGCAKILSLNPIASLCALTLIVSALGTTPARADEDPFQLDIGHWMSFDHYKDSVKRGTIAPPTLPASSLPEANNETAPPIAAPAATPAKIATPAVAAPTRALSVPPMPGLNKGFRMQVTTTEDDTAPASSAPVIATDAAQPAESDIHLSDKNWQNPATISRYKKSARSDEEDATPLDVRMSYLPDSKITPVPSPDRQSAHHDARVALEKSLVTKKPAKTATETAACAAIDAYKKQQLDAIQSDRQTLKALQEAVATLGLQKQLGFMTGDDSALNAAAISGQATQINMDIPASTSVH